MILLTLLPFVTRAQSEDVQTSAAIEIPNLVKVVNEDRAKAGLHPLRRNRSLDYAAELKVQDMVANKYFAHTSPQRLDPWHWFKEADYEYLYAGENLALDFNDAEAVQKAWMESPKHRENILNSDYEEIGYAISYGRFNNINGVSKNREGTVIVQLFGKRLPSVLSFTNNPDKINEPIANPGENRHQLLSLQAVTYAVSNLSSRMMGNVIVYEIPKDSDVAGSTLKPKTFKTDPPLETWPFVSFGLALLMVSAGIHTKFL